MSGRRLVACFSHANRSAKVYYTHEYAEYHSELYTNGVKHRDATYFTDDRNDACEVAAQWVLQAGKEPAPLTSAYNAIQSH